MLSGEERKRLDEYVTYKAVELLGEVIEGARKLAPIIVNNNAVEVTIKIHDEASKAVVATVKREVE